MERLRERFLWEDNELHNKYFDRKSPLNLVINSKNEIITAHRCKIQFYSSELYNFQDEIILENKIRDILLIDDDFLVATKNGMLQRFKREDDFQYSLYSQKLIDEDIDFRHLIKLDEKNLICAFSKSNIYIINIDSYSIDCRFTLPKKLYMDARTKPFILSKDIICFRQANSITIFNYKKMRIIKTIDLTKNSPFQIYKDVNEKFFYIVSIVLSLNKKEKDLLKTHIEVIKYDEKLNVLEKSKIKIKMPDCSIADQEYDKDIVYKNEGIESFDHYCIYRCIVQNIKNYSFILHGYRGPPFEEERFFIVQCKNGKIEKYEKNKYQYLSCDYSFLDYVYIKNKDKTILAYAEKNDDEITFE